MLILYIRRGHVFLLYFKSKKIKKMCKFLLLLLYRNIVVLAICQFLYLF
jgi:hypothetical protein